jgi:hypothetical protein
MTSSSIHYLALFVFWESLEIAYSVIAVDNMKKPTITNDREAKGGTHTRKTFAAPNLSETIALRLY